VCDRPEDHVVCVFADDIGQQDGLGDRRRSQRCGLAAAVTVGRMESRVQLRDLAPEPYLHTISTLGGELKKIEAQLDQAVAAARAEGISWDRIGRAYGVTRQGARKRWDAKSPSNDE
jgi:hypothetical protein